MKFPHALLALILALVAIPARAGVDVQIHGLGDAESDNAYAKNALLGYAKGVDASKGEYDIYEVQRRFDEGPADIRAALQPFGWYNPVIHSELRGAKPDWTAIYTVDAGPPTTIANVDVQIAGEGHDSEALAKVLQKPRLNTGDRLRHENYEALKTRLMQAANADGYLDAAFTRHELRVDVATNTAAIELTLDTGPRYYFGDVTIDQDGRLDDAFLRRYITFVPGQPFTTEKLLGTQFALTDLDYFRTIEVVPQRERAGPDHRIPILIHTASKPPRIYKFGAGYGTDTGARALASTEFRRLNRQGHKLTITLQPSQNISAATAEYRIPIGHSPGDNVAFTAQGLTEDVSDINEHLYTFGTSLSRRLGSWSPRYYLQYMRDAFAFSGEPQTISRLLIPGASFSHSDLDDPIYPRLGWSIFMDLHGADDSVFSDATFIQGYINLHGVVPLFPRIRLLMRAEQGATMTSKFAFLPTSQRFFAGGDQSVRGYSYKSLGPTDAKGRIIGGKFLTTGSAEVDYDLLRHYAVAAFFDLGGADDSPQVRLHEGVGVGVRYRAPFGAIMLDIAHPLDQDAKPIHLHFGIRVGL
jgi:translocation and assembly module TamA